MNVGSAIGIAKDYFIGAEVGAYRIAGKLGDGTRCVVYRGTHVFLGTPAAIKFFHSDVAGDAESVGKAFAEAMRINGVGHPNITGIIDLGRRGNRCYVVMELLEGQTLLARLSTGRPLSLRSTLSIGSQLASALVAAHNQGVAHKTLKASNVYMGAPPDNRDHVKVCGLGFHYLTRAESGRSTVGVTASVPEEAVEEAVPNAVVASDDCCLDMEALAGILYAMATGVVLGDPATLRERIAQGVEFGPAHEDNAESSSELQSILYRATAQTEEARFANMQEFCDALLTGEASESPRSETPIEANKRQRTRGRATTSVPPADDDEAAEVCANVLAIVLERIEEDRLVLPTMPVTALAAVDELDNPNVTFKRIADIVGNDPVLASQLYRRASQSRFGNAAPPQTMVQAISRFGMVELKKVLVELCAHEVYQSRNRKIRQIFKGIWNHTIAVGLGSRAVAESLGEDSSIAHLAGLMHDVGKPIVSSLLLEAEKQLGMDKKDWLSEKNWVFVVEKTHRKVGIVLAKKWQLPNEVVQAIGGGVKYSSDPADTCANIVRFVNAFAKRCGRAGGPFDPEEIENIVAEGVDCLELDWIFVHKLLRRTISNVGEKDDRRRPSSTLVLR